jgi:hypothetical protein
VEMVVGGVGRVCWVLARAGVRLVHAQGHGGTSERRPQPRLIVAGRSAAWVPPPRAGTGSR